MLSNIKCRLEKLEQRIRPEVEAKPWAIAQVRTDEKLFGSLICDTTCNDDGQLIFLKRAPKTKLQIIKEARELTHKSKESNVTAEAMTVPVPEASARTWKKMNKGGRIWKD